LRCLCYLYLAKIINAGITSGAKGALDLWRKHSLSSGELEDEHEKKGEVFQHQACIDADHGVSRSFCLIHNSSLTLGQRTEFCYADRGGGVVKLPPHSNSAIRRDRNTIPVAIPMFLGVNQWHHQKHCGMKPEVQIPRWRLKKLN